MILKKYASASIAVSILLAACALQMSGCSTASISGLNGELPKDLPQDMQNRFEIKETSQPAASSSPPSVSPSPTPLSSTAKKDKKLPKAKTKKSASNQPSTTPSVSPSEAPTLESTTVYPNRRPERDPILVGEALTYDINYFGVQAGQVTFKVMPHKYINDRKVYHVVGNAVSSKVFSLFYKLNDSLETFFDFDGLFSHRFHLVLDETKQTRDSLELYDSEKKQTFYWNRWNHKDKGKIEIKDFYPMPQFPQDSLSALYYLRTLPLKTGDVYTFPVASEGKSWDAVVTVVRREMMDTPLGRVRTVVLKPEAKYQGILKKNGDSFVWLTDDDRRFLVHLEAKVRIGTVVADLQKVEPGELPR